MPSISFSSVNRYLQSLSSSEMIQEVKKLFDTFPRVKEYYHVKLAGSGQKEIIEKYKKIIEKEFHAQSNSIRPGRGSLSVARKDVLMFGKLSDNNLDVLDMMLLYVEKGIAYARCYGLEYEQFYASMERMYETACAYAKKHGLNGTVEARCRQMVHDTSEFGWGFHEALAGVFEKYFLSSTVVIDV